MTEWPTGLTASFQLLTGDTEVPAFKSASAAGFDIAVIEQTEIPAGDTRKLRTGLIIKPPAGHWTMIVPRSSLQKKGLVLANQVGVVDEDYCGPEDEIFVVLRNVTNRPVAVDAGERVVQGIFVKSCRPEFVPEMMAGKSRGGFGSTGR